MVYSAGKCPESPALWRGQGAQSRQFFLSGKLRRACPVLTGWPGASIKANFWLNPFNGNYYTLMMDENEI